jgi:hypothetical protein
MNAFGYVKNNVFVRLKPSPISGIGVFAIKDIPIDTFLFQEWKGETGFYPISQAELNELDSALKTHILDMFEYTDAFPNDTNIYIKLTNGCHWIYTNPYYFINSGYYENKSNVDRNTMKSIKFIKRGEELLGNYKRYEKISKKLL